MSENNSSGSGGIGFFGALTVLLIGLKLTGCIAWSWWWVWSPLWGPVVAFGGLFVIAVLVSLAFDAVRRAVNRKPNCPKSVFYEEMLSRARHEQWMEKQADKEVRQDRSL